MKPVIVAFFTACAMSGSLAAQVDLSGYWHNPMQEDQPERGGGPLSGEYIGIPLNDAARMRADAWSASSWTVPERQCIPHPADYGNSFSSLEMWKDADPESHEVVAWHTHMSWMAVERTIWMDGRPHPPDYAPHTWQGFSTGKWEKNILTVTTTHLKAGWIRRNGIPRSDRATLVEHFMRDGDVLTWVTIVTDPENLTEPMVRSRDFTLNPYGQMGTYPCEPAEEIVRAEGVVPFYLPGKNPFLQEFARKYNLPQQAARGGAATMYPEYQETLRTMLSGTTSPAQSK
jgi:hypothetical protein